MISKFCPRCDSLLVKRSRPRYPVDWLRALISIYPFRCQSCRHRFYLTQRGARDTTGTAEHRIADRTPVRIPVRFEWGEGQGEGVMLDLSHGGCAIESKRRLKPGLLLRLQLPAGPEKTPESSGQHLVTVRSVHGDRAGVKFLVLTPQEKTQLDHTITAVHQAVHA